MKKVSLILMAVVAMTIGLTSCVEKGAELYEVTIQVNYPDGYSQTVAPDVLVTITNSLTSRQDTARTDENGIATIKLALGTYSLSASDESEKFYFNGSAQNMFVMEGDNHFILDLVASSKSGGLIFKEIYYCGSTTTTGTAYNSDQFHEIYNNSDDTLYLDGLCLGILEPIPTETAVAKWATESRLPITFQTWMFPGTGETYPIYPRTSVVVAQDAINHKSDPVIGNPNSPVDLGNAQYETFVDYQGKDADAAGAKNLIQIYTTSPLMSEWSVYLKGSAVVIFRIPSGVDYNTFVSDPNNFMYKPGTTSGMKYLMIDKSWVVDGVEEVYPDAASHFKRLPVSVDAGIVFLSGSNLGKSIRRKVAMILDGKVIYQDTNNSTNDFNVEVTPTPFVNPTTVDAR